MLERDLFLEMEAPIEKKTRVFMLAKEFGSLEAGKNIYICSERRYSCISCCCDCAVVLWFVAIMIYFFCTL